MLKRLLVITVSALLCLVSPASAERKKVLHFNTKPEVLQHIRTTSAEHGIDVEYSYSTSGADLIIYVVDSASDIVFFPILMEHVDMGKVMPQKGNMLQVTSLSHPSYGSFRLLIALRSHDSASSEGKFDCEVANVASAALIVKTIDDSMAALASTLGCESLNF